MARSQPVGEEELLPQERRLGGGEDGDQFIESHGAEAHPQHLEEELYFSRTIMKMVLEGRVFGDNWERHAGGRDISNTRDEDEAVDNAGDGLDVERRRHGSWCLRVPAKRDAPR